MNPSDQNIFSPLSVGDNQIILSKLANSSTFFSLKSASIIDKFVTGIC